MRKFLLAFAYHYGGQAPRVYGRITQPIDDVGNASYVVEMSVSNEYSAYLLAPVLEIFGVGEYVVDARRVLLAELQAAVDDDYVIAHFYRRHVAAYLLHAAQRHYADIAALEGRNRLFIPVLRRRFRQGARRVRLVRPRPSAPAAPAA